MRKLETAKIRNLGIIGHGGEGKTSLVEAILFNSGAISRLGRVEDGTTTTDFDEDEIARKNSISSAIAFCEWKGHEINLIDTPGFSNFLADTKICLRVADAAVVVVSATSGVRVQTEKVWQFANDYDLPRLVFINKMDRDLADFFRTLKEIREGLSPVACPLQIPIGAEASFQGVVDLLSQKALLFREGEEGKCEIKEIPAELKEEAAKWRGRLLEAIAETDDSLLEKYLDSGDLSPEEVDRGLREATFSRKIVPVLCGSATKNIGIAPLLDLMLTCCPTPLDRPAIEGENPKTKEKETRSPAEGAPLAALVFKTLADPYAGKMTLFRVYSGQISSDSVVYNATRGVKERVGQLVQLRGKTQIPVPSLGPGELGAMVKLKETNTGDTLCDEKAPLLFPPVSAPNPVISFAIEPKSKGDEDKLSSSLSRLMEEDPSLRFGRDPQTKQAILSGMGEMHLEVTVARLKRKFGVEVNVKTPRVPYKETIRASSEAQGKYKKQTGGRGQYGDCWLRLEPLPRGGGYEFANQIVGGVIPRQYIPAVEKGVVEAMEEGVLAGYPVTDVKVTVYDGSYHPVDSSEIAFKIAGSMGFKKGVMAASPILLEPIMNVEISVPDECMGDVIGDLNSKRGRVQGVEAKSKTQLIRARVPLAEMLKYASELKSMTGDRGDYTMDFSHYEEVPAHIQEKIVEMSKKEREEEK
ncbi:MAG: elongation factor G [candidate division NC10 bacterium]|nr:elongation factor G [candidate division NC10 bacterium]